MSIKIQKTILMNVVSPLHEAVIKTQEEECELIYEVASVNISGEKAYVNASISVNGIQSANTLSHSFNYNPDGGNVISQAEKSLLTLDELSGAKISY